MKSRWDWYWDGVTTGAMILAALAVILDATMWQQYMVGFGMMGVNGLIVFREARRASNDDRLMRRSE